MGWWWLLSAILLSTSSYFRLVNLAPCCSQPSLSSGAVQNNPLENATSTVLAHPLLYRWHWAMVAAKVSGKRSQTIAPLRTEGAEPFALPLSKHDTKAVQPTLKALAKRREEGAQEKELSEKSESLEAVLQPVAQAIVYRTPSPLRIDGNLDEPEWRLSTPLPLADLQGRSAPTTIARLLWDDRFLYIAFECTDPDIWATKTQRDDFLWEEEVVEVFIDPEGDGLNYYEFQVNPLGTEIDLLIPDAVEGVKHGKRNAEWNCQGWRSAVQVRGTVNQRDDKDSGWTAEMAIPWSGMPHPAQLRPNLNVAWRINLYRIERPSGKEGDPLLLSWSKCVRWFHEPERFGRIVFAGNPLADDFRQYPNGSDGRPTWQPVQGQWAMRDGVYYGTDGGTDGFIAQGTQIGLREWRNYEVTVRFRLLSVGSDWRDGFWLAVRFADPDNAYSLNFYHGQGGIVQLHKVRNGISTSNENPMAQARWTPDQEWHEVRVRVEGNRITAWLDGRELFSVVDHNHNGTPPVEHGAIVLSPRRWSHSKGHTQVAFSQVLVRLLPP